MTDNEILLNHDIAALKGEHAGVLRWNAALIQDAIDAIEINEPSIALSRLKRVLNNLKG